MSVSEKVNSFSNTILVILSNFIPYEILTCNDKDLLCLIKNKNNPRKNNAFKAYCSNSRTVKNYLRNIQGH